MRITPAWWKVATMRWAMEIEPMFSIGLNSPMREDMPAATTTAPICTNTASRFSNFISLHFDNLKYTRILHKCKASFAVQFG